MSNVRQCDSCNTIAQPWGQGGELPAGWGSVRIELPGSIGWGDSRTVKVYELCSECVRKPIVFGNVQLSTGKS